MEVNPTSKVGEFGEKLRKLTDVKSDTLKLLVPQTKSSILISPFSDEHSNLSLLEASILEGGTIRMMGAFDNEIKEVSQTSTKSDLRILGFDEEEERLRRRALSSVPMPLKLPQGDYIFCNFRTLHLQGIELNPPPSEALRRMHRLACDPGIIAIMNKHRWRVGIMTELAPVGYVGISPKCLLGFNKNHGEEISLRLRTDDLKGFRKYESIKKTLLHELAHMVYSEHDADFFALNKQLNEEAASLDWTKSSGHTLSGRKISGDYEEELNLGVSSSSAGQKLGGISNSFESARASSVAAAYSRFLNSPSEEPSRSDRGNLLDATVELTLEDSDIKEIPEKIIAEPDPSDTLMVESCLLPPLESSVDDEELDPDDLLNKDDQIISESNPDDSMTSAIRCDPGKLQVVEAVKSAGSISNDMEFKMVDTNLGNVTAQDTEDSLSTEPMTQNKILEPDTHDNSEVVSGYSSSLSSGIVKVEYDPDDENSLQRIEEPVAAFCSRIQKAIEKLRFEASPVESCSALQTLVQIIRNVIEHPGEMKFRRLRKSNPKIQKDVVKYEAAMEVLTMVGFSEDTVSDEIGRAEAYLVLKRDDPGLLWLAKSSIEVAMA